MTSRTFSGLWWCLALTMACQRDKPPEQVPEPEAKTAMEVSAARPEVHAPSGLVVKLESMEGGYQLHIQNRGAKPVEHASQLSLERKQHDKFETVSGQLLRLIADCKEKPDACMTLAPGAERIPKLLSPHLGDMQCASDGAQLPVGEYRVVLHGCMSNAYQLPSESFFAR